MRGAINQIGKVEVVKDKPNLTGLLDAGKVAHGILQTPVPANTTRTKEPIEVTIRPKVATPLYQAIREEFPSERQMKRYYNKIKKTKEMKKIPEEAE